MLLQSDIARLILGYLAEQNMPCTFNAFLNESSHVGTLCGLFSQGLSSPYISTLTMFGKTLCVILDEYSCMKETETQYLRSKRGQLHHTTRIVQLWEQFENACTMLRSYQIASLVDCHSHADRSFGEIGGAESGQRKVLTPGQGKKQQGKVVRKVLKIGNPQMVQVQVPVSTQAQKEVTTQQRSPTSPAFRPTVTTVPSSVELNRRKKTQGAPKRLSDVERRDVQRSTQKNTEVDPASLLLRNVSNNEPETIAVVGATILNHMKKCSNTKKPSETDEPNSLTLSSPTLPIDPNQTKSHQESIANLTVDSLLESDFLRPDNTEFMKDLETLLSLSSGMEEKDENIETKQPASTSIIEIKTPSPPRLKQPTTLDEPTSQDPTLPVLEPHLKPRLPKNPLSSEEVAVTTSSEKPTKSKNQKAAPKPHNKSNFETFPDVPPNKESVQQNMEDRPVAKGTTNSSKTIGGMPPVHEGVSQQETAAAVRSLLDITNEMRLQDNAALNPVTSNDINLEDPPEDSEVLEDVPYVGNEIVLSSEESMDDLPSYARLLDNLEPDEQKSTGGFFHLGQISATKEKSETSPAPDEDVMDSMKLQQCRVTLSTKEIEKSGYVVEKLEGDNTDAETNSIFATPTKRMPKPSANDLHTPVKSSPVEILHDSPAKCTRSKIAAVSAGEKQDRTLESSDSSSRSRSRERLSGGNKMPRIKIKSAYACRQERSAAAKAAKKAKSKSAPQKKTGKVVKSSQDKSNSQIISTSSSGNIETDRGRSPTKKDNTVENDQQQHVDVSPTLTILDAVKLQSKSSTDDIEPCLSEDQTKTTPLENTPSNAYGSPRKLTLRYGLRAVDSEVKDLNITPLSNSVASERSRTISYENNVEFQNHETSSGLLPQETSDGLPHQTTSMEMVRTETSSSLKNHKTRTDSPKTTIPKSPILGSHRSHVVSNVKPSTVDDRCSKSPTDRNTKTRDSTPSAKTESPHTAQLKSPSFTGIVVGDRNSARKSSEAGDRSLFSPYIGRTVQLNEQGHETELVSTEKNPSLSEKLVSPSDSEVLTKTLPTATPTIPDANTTKVVVSPSKMNKNTKFENLSSTTVTPIYTSPTTNNMITVARHDHAPIPISPSTPIALTSTQDADKVKKKRPVSVKKHRVIRLSKQEEKLGLQNILDRLVKQVKDSDAGAAEISNTPEVSVTNTANPSDPSNSLDVETSVGSESKAVIVTEAKTVEDSALISNLCRQEVTGESLTLLLNETSLTQVMSAARELNDEAKPAAPSVTSSPPMTSVPPVTSATASPEQSKMKFTTISPTAGIFSVFGDDENVTSANASASEGLDEKSNVSLKKWLNTECTQTQQQSPLSVCSDSILAGSSTAIKHWFTPVATQQQQHNMLVPVGARRNLDFVPLQVKTSTPVCAPAPQHYEGTKKPRYRKLLPKNTPFHGISGSGIDVFETRSDIIKANFPQGAVRRSLEVQNNSVDNRLTFVMTPVTVKPASTFKPVTTPVPVAALPQTAPHVPITSEPQVETEAPNSSDTNVRKLRRRTTKVSYNETEIANNCFSPFSQQKFSKAPSVSTTVTSKSLESPEVSLPAKSDEVTDLQEEPHLPVSEGLDNKTPESDRLKVDKVTNVEASESKTNDSDKFKAKSENSSKPQKKKKSKKKKKQSESKNVETGSGEENGNIVLRYLNKEEEKLSSPEESRLMIMESSISEDEAVKSKKKKSKKERREKEKREKSKAKKRKAPKEGDEDKKRASKRQKKLLKSLNNMNVDELTAILNQVHGNKTPSSETASQAGSSDSKSTHSSKTVCQETPEAKSGTDRTKRAHSAQEHAAPNTNLDGRKENTTNTPQSNTTTAAVEEKQATNIPSDPRRVTHDSVSSQSKPRHTPAEVSTTSFEDNGVGSLRSAHLQSKESQLLTLEKHESPAKPAYRRATTSPTLNKSLDSSVFKAPSKLHDSVLSPCSNEVSLATDEGSNSRRAKLSRGHRRQKRRISLTQIPISPSKLGASPLHLRTPSPVVTCRDSPNTVSIVAESLIELSRSKYDSGDLVVPERSEGGKDSGSKGAKTTDGDGKITENVGKEAISPLNKAASQENLKSPIVLKQKSNKDSPDSEVKLSKKKSKHKKRKTMSLDNLDIGKFLSKIKYD